MKIALLILIIIDLCFYTTGTVMYLFSAEHYGAVIGMGILFLTFVIAPYFVVYEMLKRRKEKKL